MAINKEIKQLNLTPILPCKLSWNLGKKDECDNIIHNWQITFQVSDLKGNHFLELLDDRYLLANLTCTKGGPWLKQISHLNSLCARATRAITNHAPIREYRLRFFPRENTVDVELIQSNQGIIFFTSIATIEIQIESLSHFFYPGAFSFHEEIT